MVLNPVVKVCTAPPMPKITAPANKVPLLPKMSPICPAAMEVTCEMDQITAKKGLIAESLLKAPISSTATIVPTSNDPGELKYLRKWGPVIIPDITLR